MEGKWLLGLGEERHRRWVMAERLWGKRTERWGAGRAVCVGGAVRGRRCKSVTRFGMGSPPLFLRDKLKNKGFLF